MIKLNKIPICFVWTDTNISFKKYFEIPTKTEILEYLYIFLNRFVQNDTLSVVLFFIKKILSFESDV